ncbi:hypothetical protein ECP03052937_5214 [Escherichia coli p0305293.7]|nr:hypothetical protein ECP030529311_5018 [Escherichia coli p0305293.11]ENH55970.1 hypothetical protein ECP03052937_5214 [Escherichia coli p0305293.7]
MATQSRCLLAGRSDIHEDVFLKRLTAPTITSGGNPPDFP